MSSRRKIKENYFLLGRWHEKLGNYKLAILYLGKAAATSRNKKFRGRIHFYLGKCYEKEKLFSKAINSYKIAAKNFPEEASIYAGAGRAYFALKKFKSAAMSLNKAKKISPSPVEINSLF